MLGVRQGTVLVLAVAPGTIDAEPLGAGDAGLERATRQGEGEAEGAEALALGDTALMGIVPPWQDCSGHTPSSGLPCGGAWVSLSW